MRIGVLCLLLLIFDVHVASGRSVFDYWGIVKVDIGLKNGCIYVIGKVGNFDIQFGVDIVIGLGIEVIVGEGKIIIVGGIDVHIYFIVLQQIEEVLYFGVIIMMGGGIGLVVGISVIICMFGFWYLMCMLQVVEVFLMNFGFFGKGNVLLFVVLEEQIFVGACGMKLHEDWGIMFVVIDI